MFEIYKQMFDEMMAKDELESSQAVKICLKVSAHYKRIKDNLIYSGICLDNLDENTIEKYVSLENNWKVYAIDCAKIEKAFAIRLIEDQQYFEDLMIQKYGDIDYIKGLSELRFMLIGNTLRKINQLVDENVSTKLIEGTFGDIIDDSCYLMAHVDPCDEF